MAIINKNNFHYNPNKNNDNKNNDVFENIYDDELTEDEHAIVKFYTDTLNALEEEDLNIFIMDSLREVAYEMKKAEGYPMVKFYYEEGTGFCVDVSFLGMKYYGGNPASDQRKLLPYTLESVAEKKNQIDVNSSNFNRKEVFKQVFDEIITFMQGWLRERGVTIFVETEEDTYCVCKAAFR